MKTKGLWISLCTLYLSGCLAIAYLKGAVNGLAAGVHSPQWDIGGGRQTTVRS